MKTRPSYYFLFFFGLSLASSLASADSLREYHQRMCNQGNLDSCKKAEAMLQGEHLADRIVELGDNFAATVNRLKREENNKPLLRKAYIDVLEDYFKSSTGEQKQSEDLEIISLCAEHYHDYWRNRKVWWPTQEDGRPDWATIYYYIVDHYYGYCIALSNL
ncbi:MAG: hypothetical protein CMF40_03715 [Legionellales bacterium]|nr:hypothetical protein [Legionellales bacterium]|tara:strand:- start:1 stop:483 length:483 start_codon:yes stop_codon:yes gene_type:complete